MVTIDPNAIDVWPCPPLSRPEVLDDMAGEPDPDVDWLWEGFLARGCVTLLTSQWKTGKTTLLSVLLSQLHTGGELAGRKVSPGRVVVLSEEDRMHWRMRSRRLKFGPHALAYCRPFKTNPSRAEWQALVDELVRRRAQDGLDLVVFDTLSMLLPLGTENQFDIYEILRPLEQLTSAGVSILLMHHPRKGMNLPGQAGSRHRCAHRLCRHRDRDGVSFQVRPRRSPPAPGELVAILGHAGGVDHRVDRRRPQLH